MATTAVDIIDETYIRAASETIRAHFDDRSRQERIWPHLELELVRDRGRKGWRWAVTGAVVGEMELWIEPYWDGAIVHHYVRGTRGPSAPSDVVDRHRRRWKREVHSLKDYLERTSL